MNPYFYHIEGWTDYKDAEHVIYPGTAAEIVQWVRDNWIDNDPHYFLRNGANYFFRATEIADAMYQTVHGPNFARKINLTIMTRLVMAYGPNFVAPKHRDPKPGRMTVLSVPDYAPIDFWDYPDDMPESEYLNRDDAPAATLYPVGIGKAFLFDASKVHSVRNNDKFRMQYQISFAEDLQTVVSKIKDGSFWKNPLNPPHMLPSYASELRKNGMKPATAYGQHAQ